MPPKKKVKPMEGQKSLFSFVKKTSESDKPRSSNTTTDDIDRPSTSLGIENQRSSDEVSDDKVTKKRNFQKGWLVQYPWLKYDHNLDLMFCNICIGIRANNAMTQGTNNFRTSTLYL